MSARRVGFAASVVLAAGCTSCLGRDAFSTYGGTFRGVSLPPVGSGSFGIAGDVMADGRIIAATGTTVYLERGVGLGVFDAVAALDASFVGGSIDPAFLRVSPDGTSIAVGAGFNKPVAVFAATALGTAGAPTALTGGSGGVARYYNVQHFDGAWADASHLALTAGDFGAAGFVSLLDVSSDVVTPLNPTIVRNIGGASSGIAFDSTGRLYTGNGYDLNPSSGSNTGTIRAFNHADWSGGSVDFEVGGTLIGEVLSAGSLDFDAEGNLFVGGGDFPDDAGYLGVVGNASLAGVLAGGGPIDAADGSQVRRLDPLGSGFGYFGSVFNAATGELSVTDGTTWYVTIPGPGSAGVLMLAAIGVAGRRRGRGGREVAHV